MRTALAASAAALLLLGAGTAVIVNERSSMGFDATVWKAQRDEDFEGDNPRAGMVGELQRNHLVEGTPRERIHDLLGPPESVRGETDLYELGRSATGVDYEQLAIVYEDDELARTLIKRT